MREFPLPQEILKVFEHQPGKTFRLRELVVELGLRSSQARDLKNALKVLSRQHRIVYLKKNHFALASKERQAGAASPEPRIPNPGTARTRGANVTTGRLIGHRDGYGFVVPDAPLAGSDQDIYISSDGMGSAPSPTDAGRAASCTSPTAPRRPWWASFIAASAITS
jgi:exoribonuclease R